METGDSLTTALGVMIVALSLWDIFLAVLHLDRDGILAPRLHRLIWTCLMFLARRFPRSRRALLALAGPAMMVLSSVMWISLFILGFALIVWPHMNESFRSDDEIRTLTFSDALYFSGITGTVLGHGDITPLTAPFKVVAFIEAGLGFALLTGIVTYLLSVVNGVMDRNVLALRLQNEVQHGGSGIDAMIRRLKHEELGDVRLRLESLTASLKNVQEKIYQFPILDLYYRSLDPRRDPEPMIQTLAETAIAGKLLAQQEPGRRLLPVSEDLARGITQLIQIMATQFLSSEVRRKIAAGHPEDEDRVGVENLRTRLKQGLHGYFPEDETVDTAAIAELAFRVRIFLNELDGLTDWKTDHPGLSLAPSIGSESKSAGGKAH